MCHAGAKFGGDIPDVYMGKGKWNPKSHEVKVGDTIIGHALTHKEAGDLLAKHN